MTNPMAAEEARTIADSFPGYWNHYEQTRIKVGLRAYAAMLDRQTVDREAIGEIVCEAYYEGVSVGKNDSNVFSFGPLTDRILALMPAAPVVAKELEWREIVPPAWLEKKRPNRPRDHIAHTPFGNYHVCYDKQDADWFFTAPSGKQFDGFETSEATKAAAQAHYNDAIAKAVKPGPDVSGLVEALEALTNPSIQDEFTDVAVEAWAVRNINAYEYDETRPAWGQICEGEVDGGSQMYFDFKGLISDAVNAALATLKSESGSVSDGMVMVPREPTEAMIIAGEYVTPAVIWEQVRAIYRAMIEAAKGGE